MYLEEAIKLGFKDFNHFKTDPDLENIRDTEEFRKLASSQIADDTSVRTHINIERHSVPGAVFSSFLPIWSGSWNTEFTGWGFAFVLMKTGASAFLVYSIATYDSGGHSLGVTQTTTVNGETTTKPVSDSAVRVALSSAVLVINIIADCIYSGIKTKRYNYNQENKNAFSLGDDKLFLVIDPKIEYLHNNYGAISKSLGFNVGVIRRF